MSESCLRLEREGSVARLVMDRPAVHNAFDERLVAALTEALERLAVEDAVRCVVITGAGRSFSAGADLDWMRRTAAYGFAENIEDARRLARMLAVLDQLPKPTVAMVNGAAIGGGTGIVAACDVAIAARRAVFAFSEVRLGLVPAVISPYVVRAIGARAARRYFLTGERFSAEEARRIGLVHEVVDDDALANRTCELVNALLAGGPEALAEAKALVGTVAGREGSLVAETTARILAERRASREGQEGVLAFLEKRRPGWRGDGD
ncbi:Enoyl-CoA-hydratase [bacterium HR40]|nr:Enoyl-CoA-hydratase [bacterium HR40]